jgi:ribosomal protein S1
MSNDAEIIEVEGAEEAQAGKEKTTGTVKALTLAGALVDIGKEKPGFVHLARVQQEPVNKLEDVLKIGQDVEVWVLREDERRDHIDLTMIEPLGLEWRELHKGMVVKGTVQRIENFGAFVEIGAERPGLVHISEMAHRYIRNPHEIVKIGEEVEAQILQVNRRRKQIKLSLKSLIEQADPLEQLASDFVDDEEEDDTPVPTAMEMALRQAMQKSEASEQSVAEAEEASRADEREDVLARTLAGYTPSEN